MILCPYCDVPMSRLHTEGVYCMIACDKCEGHGPRVRVTGKYGPCEADERLARLLCKKSEPSILKLIGVKVKRFLKY